MAFRKKKLQHKMLKLSTFITVLLGLIGAFSGIPWIHAASSAAVIFPEGFLREWGEILFAAGIVITVGADGLWIMLQISKQFFLNQTLQTANLRKKPYEMTKWGASLLCAMIGSLPAVYATATYNTGAEKFLAILTFIAHLGYGLYGYSTLIGGIIEKLTTSKATFSITQQEPMMKKAIQLFSAITVSLGAGLVDLFLIKHFIVHSMTENPALIYGLALLIAIPNMVINFISTRELSGKIIDKFFYGRQFDPLLYSLYPKLSTVLPLTIFLIALTAPSAGAYITYSTLSMEKSIPEVVIWLAVSSIITARFFFSTFTLNRLINEVIFYYSQK